MLNHVFHRTFFGCEGGLISKSIFNLALSSKNSALEIIIVQLEWKVDGPVIFNAHALEDGSMYQIENTFQDEVPFYALPLVEILKIEEKWRLKPPSYTGQAAVSIMLNHVVHRTSFGCKGS